MAFSLRLLLLLAASLFLLNSPSFGQSSADSLWSFDTIRTDLNGDGLPDFLNQKVTVTGVVNVDTGLFHEHYLQIFIQNDSTGMSVFSTAAPTPLAIGDSIIVHGKIDRFYGMTEVHADSYRVIKRDAEFPVHSLEDAIINPTKFLGMIVEGSGRVIEKGRSFNGKFIKVKPRGVDGDMMVYVSNFHRLFSDFNFDVLSVGDEISVKGIITEYNPEFPDQQVFKLFLRTTDDLKYRSIPKYYIIMLLIVLGIGITFIAAWTLILRLRVKSKTNKIQESLNQKEVLLKEVHHRVKNSLSIVSGLIEIQRSSTDNEEVVEILKDCQTRINSVGLIHDKLYKSDSLTDVKLDEYIRQLVKSIHETFSEYYEKVSLEFEMETIKLDTHRTIYCGLLISELVVNSFKHALSKVDDGKLIISIRKDGDNVNLIVSDNGPGLPDNFDSENADNLGTLLIKTFATHLKAEMNTYETDGGGATFSFSFPFKKKNR